MIMGANVPPNTPHHMPPTFLDFQYIASWSSFTRPNRSMEKNFGENNYTVTELEFLPEINTEPIVCAPRGFRPQGSLICIARVNLKTLFEQ